MSVERLAPDAILTVTALAGTVTAIQDDPDSPDGNWLTHDGTNANTAVRVSFPAPSGSLTAGAGLQEARVLVRKNASGGNTTTCNVVLYENGSPVTTLQADVTVASLTGTVLTGTFNANLLANTSGANVELAVEQTGGGANGSGGNRRRIEIGAVELNADVTAGTPLALTAGQLTQLSDWRNGGATDPVGVNAWLANPSNDTHPLHAQIVREKALYDTLVALTGTNVTAASFTADARTAAVWLAQRFSNVEARGEGFRIPSNEANMRPVWNLVNGLT